MDAIYIAHLTQQGVAVIVATRDGELRPQLSRAWGPSLSGDRARLTVCVEAAADSAMARNLELGAPVAVTLARLAPNLSVLLTGRAVEVAAPTPDRLDVVDAHIDDFVAATARQRGSDSARASSALARNSSEQLAERDAERRQFQWLTLGWRGRMLAAQAGPEVRLMTVAEDADSSRRG